MLVTFCTSVERPGGHSARGDTLNSHIVRASGGPFSDTVLLSCTLETQYKRTLAWLHVHLRLYSRKCMVYFAHSRHYLQILEVVKAVASSVTVDTSLVRH